jgi:hypothetical protein
MKQLILVTLCLTVLFLSPNPVFSDCMDLGRSTSWYAQGGHTIIFYNGPTPLARVDVPYCVVQPSSSIRLIKNYTCDSDDIIVDGGPCSIMTITSASSGTF